MIGQLLQCQSLSFIDKAADGFCKLSYSRKKDNEFLYYVSFNPLSQHCTSIMAILLNNQEFRVLDRYGASFMPCHANGLNYAIIILSPFILKSSVYIYIVACLIFHTVLYNYISRSNFRGPFCI